MTTQRFSFVSVLTDRDGSTSPYELRDEAPLSGVCRTPGEFSSIITQSTHTSAPHSLQWNRRSAHGQGCMQMTTRVHTWGDVLVNECGYKRVNLTDFWITAHTRSSTRLFAYVSPQSIRPNSYQRASTHPSAYPSTHVHPHTRKPRSAHLT